MGRFRPLAPAILVLLAVVCPRASAQSLPADVVPDQYDLRFALDLQADTFTGSEQILVSVVKPTTRITLNALGITFKQVTIVSGWSSQPATVSVDERHQTATFTVRRRLQSGPARIRVEYSARLQTALRGFYVGRADGRKYAATQFEATDARRAFPCFDQPDMKASFLVTAVAPAGNAVISNGRVLSDTPGPGEGEHTVRFSTTRKMSTYLVALAVGDFECLEGESDQVPLRVCAIRGRQQRGRFALDAARSFLAFFDRYFGVKYPFGKLDLVAIPDFQDSGMENTAAIFFDEHDLLVDPSRAPLESQKVVAATIAHEMSHEWLGDLVTMKWWNDLWLKEGFATLLETKPIEAWKPEWHAELDEVASAEQAMAADALPSAHPARTQVMTPEEIEESYDAIVYQKAAAVLRMVEGVMGPETFRSAVAAFIKKHAYSNATAEDFWASMAEQSTRAVDRVLQTYLEQPGVPLVSIATRCVTDATSSLALAQQRFWMDPKRASSTPSLWAIPVATRPIDPQPGVPAARSDRLLAGRDQTFDLAGCNATVFGNAEATGYFRTAYAPDALAHLAEGAAAQLTPVERLRLLDDQWALAVAGRLEVGDYLSLVAGYYRPGATSATESADDRPEIVEQVGVTLRRIDDDLAEDADRARFEEWVRRLFAHVATLPNQAAPASAPASSGDVASRAAALYVLGAVGRDPDILAKAHEIVMAAGADGGDPALLDVYTRLAARTADAAVFGRIIDGIEHAEGPDARLRAALPLADLTDAALVQRAIEFLLSDRFSDPDAAATIIGKLLEDRQARSAAWPLVKTRWNEVVAKAGVNRAAAAVIDATATFCDAGARDEAKTFFDSKGFGGTPALAQSLERTQGCIDFRAAQRPNFDRWLSKQ